MCGRYASTRSDDDLSSIFDAAVALGEAPEPSYNVAPTDPVRVVLERSERQLRTVRWGLVPSWAKDRKIASRLINARSETITEKPAFKKAASRRRCLVPADGYFEWEKREGKKVPYFLHGPENVIAMAGLYELWPDPELAEDDPNKWLWTTTVLTTTATDELGHIHDRSPVIVPSDLRAAWLDPSITDLGAVAEMVSAMPEPHLAPYEVSSAVNSVRNNGPELVVAV